MPAAPAPPGPDADKEAWVEYQGVYSDWVEKASDDDLVAEMAALPVEGRPLSPSEAWRFHQCELRRRRPTKTRKTSKERS
jgi:hypothetical protein